MELGANIVNSLLRREDLSHDPFIQLKKWLTEAGEKGVDIPEAMHLSTLGIDCQPHSRIVLLKGIEGENLFFFTNYESSKAKEINLNPNVALLFYWPRLEKQIRVEGVAFKADAKVSDSYFATRPRNSQLGAWASPQSKKIDSQDQLELLYNKADKKFHGVEVPRPPNWGGYLVKPFMFEFWNGQPCRLHNRFKYSKNGEKWKIVQLAP